MVLKDKLPVSKFQGMTVTKVGVLGSGIMGSGTATDLVELAACQLVIESVVAFSAPERVCGMHFFNPAPVMKLVEVVAPITASEDAIAAATAFARACRKDPVRVKHGGGDQRGPLPSSFGRPSGSALWLRLALRDALTLGCGRQAGWSAGRRRRIAAAASSTGSEPVRRSSGAFGGS